MYEYNLGIRFENTAKQRADKVALWFDENSAVRYDELNQSANRIARFLIERGVAKRDVVCLSGDKSRFTFAAIIACLKLGAVYCVLDPNSPAERLRKILATCRPRVLFGDAPFLGKNAEAAAGLNITATDKDFAERDITSLDGANLSETNAVTGSDPAYIMFTSGSTGFPKGAVMTHANVLNLIEWAKATFAITPDDVLTNVNPLYFDNSVFDLFASLFSGARLVPFHKDESTDPKRLVDKVSAGGCTIWFSVPSLLIFLQTMRATDGKNLRSIRAFIFGGEGYPKAKLKLLYDTYGRTSELFNVYGPTECTCICSSYKISAPDFEDLQGLPPLGYIADNFAYLILSEDNERVAPGETGELCLLGPNVGQGYYNDPARTDASFVQNPLHDNFAERMYKTGDMVRFDPAGRKLHIQGRKDNQIKHMGFRIELEEIETALNCLDYVSEAAVLHANVNGLSRIVAVVASGDSIDGQLLRKDLKQIIPDYMIPSAFYRENPLPKYANGKVDRIALAAKYLQPSAAQKGTA